MTILDRAGLLAALTPRTLDVALPNGGTVRVRTITAADRIAIGQSAMGTDNKVDAARYSALLVVAAVVGEDGQRVFADEDVPALLAGPSDVFEALFGAVQSLNGMGPKAAETAEGN